MEKVIHAQESASDGFLNEFERNYAASKENRPKSTIVLCWVDSNTAVVVDVHGNRTFSTDTSQLQTSQRLHVAKSLVAVQNCQTWLPNLVATLVKDNVLPREALDKMDISLRN
ncbi:hypothetical protein V8E51_008127 [Hyaloscypha variabilis]